MPTSYKFEACSTRRYAEMADIVGDDREDLVDALMVETCKEPKLSTESLEKLRLSEYHALVGQFNTFLRATPKELADKYTFGEALKMHHSAARRWAAEMDKKGNNVYVNVSMIAQLAEPHITPEQVLDAPFNVFIAWKSKIDKSQRVAEEGFTKA